MVWVVLGADNSIGGDGEELNTDERGDRECHRGGGGEREAERGLESDSAATGKTGSVGRGEFWVLRAPGQGLLVQPGASMHTAGRSIEVEVAGGQGGERHTARGSLATQGGSAGLILSGGLQRGG